MTLNLALWLSTLRTQHILNAEIPQMLMLFQPPYRYHQVTSGWEGYAFLCRGQFDSIDYKTYITPISFGDPLGGHMLILHALQIFNHLMLLLVVQ